MLSECLRRSEAKGRGGLMNKEEGLHDASAPGCGSQTVETGENGRKVAPEQHTGSQLGPGLGMYEGQIVHPPPKTKNKN